MTLPPPPTAAPGFAGTLRTCQIIASALIAGTFVFSGVALVLAAVPADETPIVSILAAAFAVMQVGVRQAVLAVMGRPRRGPDGRPLTAAQAFQTRMIVGLALLEGAAFFNLIAYILEARWWSLAVAGGLILLMVAAYPTAERFDRFLADRRQLDELGPPADA